MKSYYAVTLIRDIRNDLISKTKGLKCECS